MFPKEYFQIFMTLISIQETLVSSFRSVFLKNIFISV